MYYNADAVGGINMSLNTYGDSLTKGGGAIKGGDAATKGGSAVPWAAIGEAIGSIISGSAQASATQKMARLQEATGMAELRWADENEKFYRKLATNSQKRAYMMKVVVSQIQQRRLGDDGVRDRKFRNIILISVSLVVLGASLPLMVKYSKK